MTFLAAGHATTSIATCWALYSLAQLPHEQDLLREELVKAFPDKSKFNPTFDEINSLEYLNCVVKETLRLYTPGINSILILFNKLNLINLVIFTLAPITSRNNIKDKVFEGYLIPKVHYICYYKFFC